MLIPDPNFSIPDPGSKKDSGSRIRIHIKEFLTLKIVSTLWVPDLDFYPSRIPDPGVKKALDPGSGSKRCVYLMVFR
jgi:hypothetical protein